MAVMFLPAQILWLVTAFTDMGAMLCEPPAVKPEPDLLPLAKVKLERLMALVLILLPGVVLQGRSVVKNK